MAIFETKTFHIYDDYMTPKSAWENIKHIIPTNKVIWEPFYGDGKSGDYLRELGFNVIHEPNTDFFQNNKGDIIVSNPPFSKTAKVLDRLIQIEKPFILILPSSKINTCYFRNIIGGNLDINKHFKIIIPTRRIQFNKLQNGEVMCNNRCNFDCFYYCYKIDLLNDKPSILWLS